MRRFYDFKNIISVDNIDKQIMKFEKKINQNMWQLRLLQWNNIFISFQRVTLFKIFIQSSYKKKLMNQIFLFIPPTRTLGKITCGFNINFISIKGKG